MFKKFKLSPFIKDFLQTAFASFITSICLIIVIRVLARSLGPEGFGVYSLSRRILATMVPFSTLAMGIAVTRFVAISKDNSARLQFLVSGLCLSTVPSIVIFIIGSFYTDQLSGLFFRNSSYSSVIFAILFMLVGHTFYTILYAFYRGSGQMGKANLWQFLVLGLGPLMISRIYADTGDIGMILIAFGILYWVTLPPLGALIFKREVHHTTGRDFQDSIGALWRYGLPRIPGGLMLAGMLGIGPILAPYFGSLQDVGYLIAGQSVFSLSEVALSAFGLLILPKAAQLYAHGNEYVLRERIQNIIAFLLHTGLYTTFHLFLWTDTIVSVWLGIEFSGAVPLMKILLFGLIPYMFYSMLRSIIDAIEVKAVNTHNLYIAFFVSCASSVVLAGVGFGVYGLATGLALGYCCLGGMTVRHLWSRHWIARSRCYFFKECMFLNGTCLFGAYLFKWFISGFKVSAGIFSAIILVELLLFFLYIFALRTQRVAWINQLEQRLIITSVR